MLHALLDTIYTVVQLPHKSLESKNPTATARIAHLQGGLWTEKGMVSRQHELGEKKELAGEGSLGAWEGGIPQVGNWQCPPSQ